MGFLDKFISKANEVVTQAAESKAADAISRTVGDIVDGITSAVTTPATPQATQTAPQATPAAAPQAAPAASQAAASAEVTGADKPVVYGPIGPNGQRIPTLLVNRNTGCTPAINIIGSQIEDHGSAEYIAELITNNYPGATVRTHADLRELAAEIPYTFVDVDVFAAVGAQRIAVIMPPAGSYKSACYIYTMNALEKAGIKTIRLFRDFENKPEYVVGRIRSLLA